MAKQLKAVDRIRHEAPGLLLDLLEYSAHSPQAVDTVYFSLWHVPGADVADLTDEQAAKIREHFGLPNDCALRLGHDPSGRDWWNLYWRTDREVVERRVPVKDVKQAIQCSKSTPAPLTD